MLDSSLCRHRSYRMRPARIITALLLLVVFIVLSAALAWRSQERVLVLLQSLVSHTTAYELELVNPALNWSPFRLNADLVLLKQKDYEGPPLVAVQQLALQMPLEQLLTGAITSGEFSARNITYYIDDSQSDEPLNLEGLLSPLSRVPASMSVDSLHLISTSSDLWIFPLENLSARRTAEGALVAIATAEIGERSVVLEARADWLTLPDKSHRLELQSGVYGRDAASEMRLDGEIDAQGAELNYRFRLDGQYENVSHFLRAFDKDAYEFAGNLLITGELEGSLDGYELTIERLELTTEDAYSFEATGVVSSKGSGDTTLALDARGDAQNLEGLLPLPPVVSQVLTRSELHMAVEGSLAAPRLSRAAIVLFGAGGTQLELSSKTLAFTLDELRTQTFRAQQNVDFIWSTENLTQLLSAADIEPPINEPMSATFSGSIDGTADVARIRIKRIDLQHVDYQIAGSAELLWQRELLSSPVLNLQLSEVSGAGALTANGAIADVLALRGIAIDLSINNLDAQRIATLAQMELPYPLSIKGGQARLLRAAEPLRFNDLVLEFEPVSGIALAAQGYLQIDAGVPEADLHIVVTDARSVTAPSLLPFVARLNDVSGQLRLRQSYVTLLLDASLGETSLQSVASLDLKDSAIEELALDIYTPHLHLADFALHTQSELELAAPLSSDTVSDPSPGEASNTLQTWRAALPDFPIHLSVRSDRVSGPMSELEKLSIAIEGAQELFLLTHLDARYAGGDWMLRGALDLSRTTASLSLAGQGLRVPLADLTRDLGLQEEVSGFLSLRGGVATTFTDPAAWSSQLQGRVSAAVSDATVSGAAYDLLMSNLLAWVVKGASEKTTRFDCAMAQFDISEGVARSSDLYLETPRMLANGKARIDIPGDMLDVRIEPRSKTRMLQFPSAVHIKGPLSNPLVSISPLQTTVDVSAQALLLLPTLTLKLFGLGAEAGPNLPCTPAVS